MQSALRTQATRQKANALPIQQQPLSAQPTTGALDARQPDTTAPRTTSDASPPDPITEADAYAMEHPLLAARIRAAGGLPAPSQMAEPDPDPTPPSPAIVETLINGTSDVLCALKFLTPLADKVAA